MTKDTPQPPQQADWLLELLEKMAYFYQDINSSSDTDIFVAKEVIEAKLLDAKREQTLLLKGAEERFGRVDWKTALYELTPREAFKATQKAKEV